MNHDQNKKTLRQFQCRDYLWEIFEQMSGELECSVDYLINEAMRQYARSRNYGVRTPGPAPAAAPPSAGSHPNIPSAPPPPQSGYGGYGGAPQYPAPPAQPAYGAPAAPAPGAPPAQPAYGAPAAPPAQPAYGAPPAYPPVQQQRPSSYPPPPPTHRPPPPPPGAAPSPYSQPGFGGPPPTGSPQLAPPPLPGGGARTGGMLPLYVIFNGQKFPVAKEEFIIGRGTKTADLPIKDGNISRRHAAVIWQNGGWYMKDLGSTNGVEFHGSRVDNRLIEEGDVYQLCDYEIRFTYR